MHFRSAQLCPCALYFDGKLTVCFSGFWKSRKPTISSLRVAKYRFEREEYRPVGGHHSWRPGQRTSWPPLCYQFKSCHSSAIQKVQQRSRVFPLTNRWPRFHRRGVDCQRRCCQLLCLHWQERHHCKQSSMDYLAPFLRHGFHIENWLFWLEKWLFSLKFANFCF